MTVTFADLPQEIVAQILSEAVAATHRDAVTYTFGLTGASLPLDTKPKTDKYVSGPARPDNAAWEATKAIRSVCHRWHDWGLQYALRDVYIRKGQGSERWADLHRGLDAGKYHLYELNSPASGQPLYHDPFRHLRQTVELIELYPETAAHIRRLWINGFHAAETDTLIWKLLRNCPRLEGVSLPWTLLRRGTADDWSKLLAADTPHPLRSLELLCLDVPAALRTAPANDTDRQPLDYRRVDFSRLRRLKIFGNTDFMPLTDRDLIAMARTASHLEELFIANNSSITIDGLTHLIASSRRTLRTIEHSPRSAHGFAHPHPGFPHAVEDDLYSPFASGTTTPRPQQHQPHHHNRASNATPHICTLLTACPRLRDLSVSIPTVCPALFSAIADTTWSGAVQVRAAGFCSGADAATALPAVLQSARALVEERTRCGHPCTVELFLGGCIFDPHAQLVHGDFAASTAALAAALALAPANLGQQADMFEQPVPARRASREDAPWYIALLQRQQQQQQQEQENSDSQPAPNTTSQAQEQEKKASTLGLGLNLDILRQHVFWLREARNLGPSGKGPYGKDEVCWVQVDEKTFVDAVRAGDVVVY